MITSTFLTRVNDALRGTDDDAPTVGDTEADYWISTFNRVKDQLYEDTTKLWSFAYDVKALSATVTASTTPTYDLDSEFLTVASQPYIITTGSNRTNLTLVHPEERNHSTRQVFVAGSSPEKLYFTNEIKSTEDIIGGTIYLPGYYLPADISGASDVLPIPSPNWAVMAVAAEIAFADITYEDKAPDLNAKANDLYRKMSAKNRRGTYANPRVSPINVYRIKSPKRS